MLNMAKVTTKKVSTAKASGDTTSVEALRAKLAEQEAELAEARAKLESGGSTDGDSSPNYTIVPGAVIYFEEKPSQDTINMLKTKCGFTFRNSFGPDRKPAWMGPAAGLVGTPFEVK